MDRKNDYGENGEQTPLLKQESQYVKSKEFTISRKHTKYLPSQQVLLITQSRHSPIVKLCLTICTLVALSLYPFSAKSPSSTHHHPPLAPWTFNPLPLGSIHPRLWLADQFNLMASGLAGHEASFYRFVSNSSWLYPTTSSSNNSASTAPAPAAGEEYSVLNEALPYYLNGIIPLAYPIQHKHLVRQTRQLVRTVLAHQARDGWLGPESAESGMRNLWARMPLLSALAQVAEADPELRQEVLGAMWRFVRLIRAMLERGGTGLVPQDGEKLGSMDYGWGRVRVADLMVTLQWMLEFGACEKEKEEEVLLDTMRLLRRYGLDWAEWYTDERYGTDGDEWFPFEHGVNVAMGLKTGAVVNRFEHNDTMVELARRAVDWTFRYHGSASGSIVADEKLAGLAPYSGVELCTTVETIYSLSYLYQALGDRDSADRAELAAFNALPASVQGDWWSHQYVTQSNQPYSKQLDAPFPFWNVNGRGQTFGLEPDYPCCTVNHIQGYPKFLANSWVTVGDDGLGHALLSPSAVNTTLGNGARITIEVGTEYPFSDEVEYAIMSSKPFVFHLRIPSWTTSVKILLAGEVLNTSLNNMDTKTGMYPIPITGHKTQVSVSFGSRSIVLMPRVNDTVAIMHGPLLYSLDVGHNASYAPPRDYKPENGFLNGSVPSLSKDWTILNTKPWNIAIDVNTLQAKSRSDFAKAGDLALPKQVWSPGAPPVYIEGTGCEIDWPLFRGVPAESPSNRTCRGAKHTIQFWPVGSTKIGMTELPPMD